MVVEELLQLLVGEVDAQLLKAVVLLDRPTDREREKGAVSMQYRA